MKATPLILIALGLSIGFRANVWNIGAEGQLTIGALAGGAWRSRCYAAKSAPSCPRCCSPARSAAWPGPRSRRSCALGVNVNEILTSLMLTYVATLILSVLVHGPWRDPAGFNFPQSRRFSMAATCRSCSTARACISPLLSLAAALSAWVLLGRTLIGFQVKVVGAAPAAASFAGFSQKRMVWLSMLVGGGLPVLPGSARSPGRSASWCR